MPARGLTRRITKKQAKSYELTSPNAPRRARQNPLGVTAIAAVMNGRGSYANRYAATRELLQRGDRMPSMQQNRRRRRARPNLTAYQYEKEIKAERAKRAARAKKAPRKRAAAPRRAAPAPRAAPVKRTLSSSQKAALAKGLAKWRKGQSKRLTAAHKKSISKKFKRVPVRIGGKTVRSYAYRTPRGKVRKIPLWAIVGAKSKKDLTARAGTKKGFARRVNAAEKARKKRAEKILLKGDLFTPNRRRSRARAIPYKTWSDTMEMNPRKRRRRTRRASANRISKTYKPKGLRGRGRHSKLTVKRRRTRTAAQRQATARMLAARWGGAFKQRKAWKNKRKTARRRKSASSPRRKLYGAALKAWRKKRGLSVSGGHKRKRARRNGSVAASPNRRRRRSRRNAAAATPNRRRRHARRHARSNQMYNANRRHRRSRRHARSNQMYNANRRRRHYRRNPDVMKSLMDAFKTGAVVALGFLAHRGLSHLLNTQLQKLAMFAPVGATVGGVVTTTAGSGADYSSALGGAIVALAGIPLAAYVPGVGAKIGAGMVADFLYQAFMTILNVAKQPTVAGYFSAYPDASGPAFHTMGSYEEMPPGFRGYGEYQMMPPGYGGFGGYGAITQAAAGYGAITQAAAGMGAITQAAAGMGEYVAQGVQGYGEYEATNGFSGGYGAYGAMDEGIPGGNTYAAERALSVAEAAAGLGDATLVSTVNPDMIAAPIMDAPGGSRSGVFQGGDGIFG